MTEDQQRQLKEVEQELEAMVARLAYLLEKIRPLSGGGPGPR